MTRKENICKIIDKLIMIHKIIVVSLMFISAGITITFLVLQWVLGAFLFLFGSGLVIFVLYLVGKNVLLLLKYSNMTDEAYLKHIEQKESRKK